MFSATCYLPTAHETTCGFGTTTDRDEFERHMKAAHPDRCTLSWRRRAGAAGGGYRMRPAFKAQTDRPFTKAMLTRLRQCDDCGTWLEVVSDLGGSWEDTSHRCTEVAR